MNKNIFGFISSVLISILIISSCGEPVPKRNHIPVLKKNLYNLQVAVENKDRFAIDSLLSPKIFDNNQSSDSLLNFVYGGNDLFLFKQFGNAEIVYTIERAQITCFIMDSTVQSDRPFIINYIYEHDLWLVTSFEIGKK